MNQLLLLSGICLAAIVSGAFGLAFPLIAGPLFLLAYKPSEALLLTACCTLLSNILSAVLLRHSLVYEFRWRLIAPVLIGVPLGAELVMHIDSATMLRTGFGLLLIITTTFCLLPRKLTIRHEHQIAETIVGLAGGVIGGMFAAPVALSAIWLNLRGLGKLEIRAILQPLVILSQVVILIVLAVAGTVDLIAVKSVILYVPSMLVGVLFGVHAFNRISNVAFITAINVLVLISGVILVIK
jgi:uncharacterized protein